MKVRVVLAAVLTLGAVSACGDSNKVGSGLGKLKDSGVGTALRNFDATPTPGNAVATAAPRATPVAAKTAPPAPTPIVQTTDFVINANGYNPYYVRVYVGGVIKATNQDSQARSVTADNGGFDSGSLQPGQSWTYKATTAGTFAFHDNTRPYVVGTLEVLSR